MNQPNILESIKIKTVSETEQKGVFEIEGLYRGYGTTLGNALRRILLSSLTGSAITKVKIKGVNHEFSSIEGVMEDVIEIALNLKKVRFQMYTDEPQVLSLRVKGEKEIKAEDIQTNAQVKITNPNSHIATLSNKSTVLEIEVTVERGLGYVPAEERKAEKLPVGTIAIDSIFTPVTNINFNVEDMRVGERTDYNRLKLIIDTDGTVSPSFALKESIEILKSHLEKISTFAVKGGEEPKEEKKEITKKTKKTSKKK